MEPRVAHWQAALFLCLLVFLAFFGAYSGSPQQPAQRTFANNCETVAQENYTPAADQQRGGFTVPVIPTPQAAIPQQATDPANENPEIQRRIADYTCQLAIYTAQLASFTRLLVIVGCIAAGFALWQGYELRRSVNGMGDEFVASHPPDIRIRHVWLTSDLWVGEEIVFNVVVVNAGKTIAFLEKGNIVTVIIDKDQQLPPQHRLPRGVDYLVFRDGVNPAPLHAGQTYPMGNHTDKRVLSDAENAALRNGSQMLYCIGSIIYRDQARRIRTTAFCRVLKPSQHPTSHLDVGRLYAADDPDYEFRE